MYIFPPWRSHLAISTLLVLLCTSCKSLSPLTTSTSELSMVYDDEHILILVPAEGQEGLYEFIVCHCLDQTNIKQGECVRAFRTHSGYSPMFQFQPLDASTSPEISQSLRSAETILQRQLTSTSSSSQDLIAGSAFLRGDLYLQETIDPLTGRLQTATIYSTSTALPAPAASSSTAGLSQLTSGPSTPDDISHLIRNPTGTTQTAEEIATKITQNIDTELKRLAASGSEGHQALIRSLKQHLGITTAGPAGTQQIIAKLSANPDRSLRILATLPSQSIDLRFSTEVAHFAKSLQSLNTLDQLTAIQKEVRQFHHMATEALQRGSLLTEPQVVKMVDFNYLVGNKLDAFAKNDFSAFKAHIRDFDELLLQDFPKLLQHVRKQQPLLYTAAYNAQKTKFETLQTATTKLQELLTAQKLALDDIAQGTSQATATTKGATAGAPKPPAPRQGTAPKTPSRFAETLQNAQKAGASDDIAEAVAAGSRYMQTSQTRHFTKAPGRWKAVAFVITAVIAAGLYRMRGAGFMGAGRPISGQGRPGFTYESLVPDELYSTPAQAPATPAAPDPTPEFDLDRPFLPLVYLPPADAGQNAFNPEFANIHLLSDNWSMIASTHTPMTLGAFTP